MIKDERTRIDGWHVSDDDTAKANNDNSDTKDEDDAKSVQEDNNIDVWKFRSPYNSWHYLQISGSIEESELLCNINFGQKPDDDTSHDVNQHSNQTEENNGEDGEQETHSDNTIHDTVRASKRPLDIRTDLMEAQEDVVCAPLWFYCYYDTPSGRISRWRIVCAR